MERRISHESPTLETRSDGKRVIVGYAARFYDPNDPGTEYALRSDVVERISRSAFDNASNRDAKALFNHDPNMLLGREGAGTVRVSVDQRGLKYEIDPPDTQVGRDVVTLVERGDLHGSSFAFSIRGDGGEKWARDTATGVKVRTLTDVELFDVGPVTFPAYASTSTGVRASTDAGECEASLKAWMTREAEAVKVRARVVEIESSLT